MGQRDDREGNGVGTGTIRGCDTADRSGRIVSNNVFTEGSNRDLTILGRQRDDDGQNQLLQINGSKDNSWYIINRMNLIQS